MDFFPRFLDGHLFGIPLEEAKQLRIKGAFKKIKHTGQMGTKNVKEKSTGEELLLFSHMPRIYLYPKAF